MCAARYVGRRTRSGRGSAWPAARRCTGDGGRQAPARSRRTVTVLFADMVGFTALGERLDPESLRRVMDRFYAEMRGAIEARGRHGREVHRRRGDGGVGHAGGARGRRAARRPRGRGHARRAAGAQRGPRPALGRAGRPAHRRQHRRGRRRPGAGRRPARRRHAERRGAARAGGAPTATCCSARRPSGSCATTADLEPVAPLELKGKARPLPAWRLRRRGRPSAARASRLRRRSSGASASSRACGRRSTARPPRARRGSSRVIGSPGVGKTRLVGRARRGVGDEAACSRARCEPAGEGATFLPLAEVLRAGGAASATTTAPRRRGRCSRRCCPTTSERDRIAERAAASRAGARTSAWRRRSGRCGASSRALAAAGASRSCSSLDDVQWAQPTLLDLLEHLAVGPRGAGARRRGRAARSCASCARAATPGDVATDVVELGPLGARESRDARRPPARRGRPAPPLADRVLETTEGNPLFLSEMLRMLVDEGVARARGRPLDRRRRGARRASRCRRRSRRCSRRASSGCRRRAAARSSAPRSSASSSPRARVAELLGPGRRDGSTSTWRACAARSSSRREGTLLADGPVFRFHHVAHPRRRLPLAAQGGARGPARAPRRLARGAGAGEHDEAIGFHLERAHAYRDAARPARRRAAASLGARAAARLPPPARRALAREDLPRGAEPARPRAGGARRRRARPAHARAARPRRGAAVGGRHRARPSRSSRSSSLRAERRSAPGGVGDGVYACQLVEPRPAREPRARDDRARAARGGGVLAAHGDHAGEAKAHHVAAGATRRSARSPRPRRRWTARSSPRARRATPARHRGAQRRAAGGAVGAVADRARLRPLPRRRAHPAHDARQPPRGGGRAALPGGARGDARARPTAARGDPRRLPGDARGARPDATSCTSSASTPGWSSCSPATPTPPSWSCGRPSRASRRSGSSPARRGPRRCWPARCSTGARRGGRGRDAVRRAARRRGPARRDRVARRARRGARPARRATTRRSSSRDAAVELAEPTDALADKADALMALAAVLSAAGRDADARGAAVGARDLYAAKDHAVGRERAEAEAGIAPAPAGGLAGARDARRPAGASRAPRRTSPSGPACATAADYDGLRALYGEDDDYVLDDRRHLSNHGLQRGVEAAIESVRSVNRMGLEVDWAMQPGPGRAEGDVLVASGCAASRAASPRPRAASRPTTGSWSSPASDLVRLAVVTDADPTILLAAYDEVCEQAFGAADEAPARSSARTRETIACLNERRWDDLRALYVEEMTVADLRAVGSPPARGPDAVVAMLRDIPEFLPDVRWSDEVVAVESDVAAVARTELRGHSADGGAVALAIWQMILVDPDGRLRRAELFDTEADALARLRVVGAWCRGLADAGERLSRARLERSRRALLGPPALRRPPRRPARHERGHRGVLEHRLRADDPPAGDVTLIDARTGQLGAVRMHVAGTTVHGGASSRSPIRSSPSTTPGSSPRSRCTTPATPRSRLAWTSSSARPSPPRGARRGRPRAPGRRGGARRAAGASAATAAGTSSTCRAASSTRAGAPPGRSSRR